MSKKIIDWHDIEDLAKLITGLHEESDYNDVEVALENKLNIGFDQFCAVVEALVPYTIPARAAISGDVFKGFVNDGWFVVKVQECAQEER
ncbi:MAG: hypothetical protein FWD62_01610 [Betaproteobacteria bacterium]|nr:hypothetical protein [Betaproteobacteria bacterium]